MTDTKKPDAPQNTETKKPEIVLCCTRCNCLTFYNHEDGRVECANCWSIMDNLSGEWRNNTAPLEDDDIPGLEDTAGCSSVVLFTNNDLSRKRIMKEIRKWEEDGELALVTAYHKNGTGKNWMAGETEEQKRWAADKLTGLADIITGGEKQNTK